MSKSTLEHPESSLAKISMIPLLLGSLWLLIPGVSIAILFIVRTALVDRTLQQELSGYLEYSGRVCYRLIPWIW